MKAIDKILILIIFNMFAVASYAQLPVRVESGSALCNNYIPPFFPEMGHSAMFVSFNVATLNNQLSWYATYIEQMGSSSSSSNSQSSGSSVLTKTVTMHAMQRRCWYIVPIGTDETFLDSMRQYCLVDFAYCDDFMGSYSVQAARENGSFGPYERHVVSEQAKDIYDRAYADYTWADLLNVEKYWNGSGWDPWDKDITSSTNFRCDLPAEWAYEKSGFLVWANCQAPNLGMIADNFDAVEMHNDLWNNDYQCNELCPRIQAGRLIQNERNSQDYTQFRPEAIESPTITYAGMYGNDFNLWGLDNASLYVYVALLYSYDGVNWDWVVDNNQITWKYKMLECQVDNNLVQTNYQTGKNLCRRSHFDYYIPVNPWTKYNARFVKAVIVDRGINYTTVVLDQNKSEHTGVYDPFPVNKYYKIVSKLNPNYCIDLSGPVWQNGQAIHLWEYYGGSNQQWKILSGAYRTYHIISKGNENFCIDDPYGNVNNGTPLQVWNAFGENQLWSFSSMGWGTGNYQIIPYNGASIPSVIDLENGNVSNGAKLQIYSSWQGDNQQWKLEEIQ